MGEYKITNIYNMETADIIRYLREERVTAFILWQTDDILDRSKDLGYDDCSLEDAEEILFIIQEEVDCEIGITWHVIENAIHNYFGL